MTLLTEYNEENSIRCWLRDGINQGKQEKAEEAAINLLRMDKLSPEEIAQAQGLTLEKVQELKEKLNCEPA